MSTVIDCPSCGRSLQLPESALSHPAQCPRCGSTFMPTRSATETSGAGLKVVVDDEEVIRPHIPGVPPPPRPLTPVLVSTSKEAAPLDEIDSGLMRCPGCRARVTHGMQRCPACGYRLAEREDERPWERRDGPLRRDCEPHRGPLVVTLGRISLCLSIPGLLGVAYFPFILASFVGTGMGIIVWVMARDDLDQMEQKVMDPAGQASTETAQTCSKLGFTIGIIGIILAALVRLPMLFAG